MKISVFWSASSVFYFFIFAKFVVFYKALIICLLSLNWLNQVVVGWFRIFANGEWLIVVCLHLRKTRNWRFITHWLSDSKNSEEWAFFENGVFDRFWKCLAKFWKLIKARLSIFSTKKDGEYSINGRSAEKHFRTFLSEVDNSLIESCILRNHWVRRKKYLAE